MNNEILMNNDIMRYSQYGKSFYNQNNNNNGNNYNNGLPNQ